MSKNGEEGQFETCVCECLGDSISHFSSEAGVHAARIAMISPKDTEKNNSALFLFWPSIFKWNMSLNSGTKSHQADFQERHTVYLKFKS